jgi:hypothetical protein
VKYGRNTEEAHGHIQLDRDGHRGAFPHGDLWLSAQLLVALCGPGCRGGWPAGSASIPAQAAGNLPALSDYQSGARQGPQPDTTTLPRNCRIKATKNPALGGA